MKVITPNAIGFRVDGTYVRYESVKLQNDTSSSSNFITTVKRMIAKGGTLQFVQNKYIYNNASYHTDTTGWPSIKEVKYKISAQKAAPTVKLDITHVVPLKSGQEYRIINAANNKKSAWVSVDDAHGEKDSKGKVKVGKILLEDLVVTTAGIAAELKIETGENGFATTEGKLDPAAIARGDVKLQVRTAANSKGVASKIYSVVVTEAAIGTATSAAALNATTGVDVGITYKVVYDKSKGITIKNYNTTADYEFCLTTSGASVTATDKWTTVKAGKSVDVKTLENKAKEAYTAIHVRKVGDKKAGVLSSLAHTYQLSGLTVKAQGVTDKNNGTVTGVSGSSVVITSAGAVTVTIPKSAVSGAAVKDATVDIDVTGVEEPGTLKWKTKGTGKGFSLDAPTFKDNKVSFKIKEIKAGTTGDSGEYVCEVQSLTLKVTVKIGN